MDSGLLAVVSAQLANIDDSPVAVVTIALLIAAATAGFTFLVARQFDDRRARMRISAERKKLEENRQQRAQFAVALSKMSQGLVMFDGAEKVVLCNERYLEIAGLSPGFVTPGRTFSEILYARKALGTFPMDVEIYRRELLDEIARGNTKSFVLENSHGRSSHVIIVPMAGGGWIATHEDITDKVAAERVIEKQKLHLNAAVANMSQGLCMFDSSQRLIVCNKQYAELYQLPDALTRPGTPMRAILEHWADTIGATENNAEYIEERLKKIAQKKPYQIINKLRDGRYVSIVHRTMADGGWVSTHEDVTEAKSQEESFRLLFDGSPMPMWVIDKQTLCFLAVNDAVIARYGYSREQFLAMSVPDLRPAEDRASFADRLRALPDDQLEARVGRHWKSDGTPMDVEIYSRSLTYDGRPARLTVIHDITKAKRAGDELARTKTFLDAVIDHVPVPIVVRDVAGLNQDARNGRYYLFNHAYEELTGDPREKLIGKTIHELYPPERADLIAEADDETLRSDAVVDIREHAIETVHKGKRLVTGKKTIIKDENGAPQYLLTVLDDVTERRQAEARIAYLAHCDSLTDLPNRATFVETLAATLDYAPRSGEAFAILCVDLDRFKEANDVYGHMVGDALLHEAARRLHTAAAGQFLARVGGDEFTLIVTDGPQPKAAVALGQRLIDAFQPAFEVEGHRLQLGLTIGGAVYPADGADAKTLIANADAALYQAKAEARGTLRLFEAKMAARLHERRDLQKDLQLAVSRNEFFLHYQPQEMIASNETTGFEALVRWQCPKRGLVAPGDFIPIAEESGLIVPLGNWILREACREAASWPRPLKIAVNISPIQFHAGDLVNQVHLVLLETGLAPARLELEITEGVLIDDFRHAVSILRKLKSLGVQIAMDDFGSGYSSLSYLHSFAFDKIKIDRSFIGDLEHNHHSKAIVRAIISLGHSLDVPLTAEGVETPAQRRILAQEGCDGLQGFLLGRPLPIGAYAGLVGRGQTAELSLAGGAYPRG